MTTLAADKPRVYEIGDHNHVGVIASDIIYEGAAVGDDSNGYARPLSAGDKFLGFAKEYVDNSAGSAGAVRVWLQTRGEIQLSVSAAAITDVGKAVYASDDDTFTFTQSTNSFIGSVKRWVSTGVVIVSFNAMRGGFGKITALTDSSGGSADGAIAAVGATNGSDVSSAINNNFADVSAKINAILAMLNK